MTVYDELRATAKELLDEFGGAATLERRTRTNNVSAGTVAVSVANISVKAVLLAPSGGITMAERRSGTIDRTRYAIINSDNEPKVDDTLLMNSIRYPITGVTAVAPDGAAIIYRMALGEA